MGFAEPIGCNKRLRFYDLPDVEQRISLLGGYGSDPGQYFAIQTSMASLSCSRQHSFTIFFVIIIEPFSTILLPLSKIIHGRNNIFARELRLLRTLSRCGDQYHITSVPPPPPPNLEPLYQPCSCLHATSGYFFN